METLATLKFLLTVDETTQLHNPDHNPIKTAIFSNTGVRKRNDS
jgi:hypothetical protein